MSALWILFGALIWFTAGYWWYGRRLSKALGIDPQRATPAHTRRDGTDYVPAKNWLVLFGHHFSSICGAGPIIGPALAVAYWGWAPAIIWLLVGAVLMGAVADFTSLFVSIRSDGHSITEVARPEISRRARLLFSWFIWLALVLVIAVFAIFAARTFIADASAVVPSFGLIPIALLTGYLLYRTALSNRLVHVHRLNATAAYVDPRRQAASRVAERVRPGTRIYLDHCPAALLFRRFDHPGKRAVAAPRLPGRFPTLRSHRDRRAGSSRDPPTDATRSDSFVYPGGLARRGATLANAVCHHRVRRDFRIPFAGQFGNDVQADCHRGTRVSHRIRAGCWSKDWLACSC